MNNVTNDICGKTNTIGTTDTLLIELIRDFQEIKIT